MVADGRRDDLRVALGLLDARHLAGDPNLTLRLRTTLLAAVAPRRPGAAAARCRELVRARHELVGELAHALGARPQGGRRRAARRDRAQGAGRDLAGRRAARRPRAVPAGAARRPRRAARGGRARDRPGRPGAVERPGRAARRSPTRRAAQLHVRELGRRIAHLSRLTWRRVDAVLARPASDRGRARPTSTPVAAGRRAVAPARWCSTAAPGPARTRCCCCARPPRPPSGTLVLAPATAARLAARRAPLPDPWPAEARDLLVRLLAAGPGLLAVWETLDETGALDRLLPEWERVRLLPHASPSTGSPSTGTSWRPASRPSALIRRVGRPDLLLVAALLHDIGKGGLIDHSVAGEPIAAGSRRGWASTAEDVDADRRRWSAGTCCSPRPPPPATRTTRRPSRWSPTRVGDRRGRSTCSRRSPRPTPGPPRPRRGRAWRAGAGRRPGRRRAGRLLGDGPPGRRSDRRAGGRRAAPRRSAGTPAGRRRRRADDGRVAGHRGRPRPGRAARRRGRRCSRCSGLRCAPPAPGPQDGVASRSGRSPTSGSTPAVAAPAARRRSSTGAARPRGAARAAGARRARAHASRSAPRRRAAATVLEVRAADRPGRRLPRLPRAGRARHHGALGPRRHARPAGGRRVLRPGGQRRRAVRRPRGRGRPRGPRGAGGRGDRWSDAPPPVGRRLPRRQADPVPTQRPEELPLVRHTLRPPRRHLQEPAGQGPALRGRHRRHRARDPASRCSRPTSRCRWSRSSWPRSRSGPAARRSARR